MPGKDAKVKLYTKDGFCPMCDFTKKWLNDNDIEFNEIKVHPTDEEQLQYLRDKGWRSFPVVIPLPYDSSTVWTGFVINKLKTLL